MASGCEFEFMEYAGEELIDINLKCSICHKPFIDPVCTSCDHTYGRSCITRWLSENKQKSCPTCQNQPLAVKDLMQASRPLRNMLDQLRVECTLCEQTGLERGNFLDHMNKFCPKAVIQCHAADIKCPWKGPRDELSDHVSTCVFEPLRPVLASLIAENRQRADQVNRHDNEIRKLTEKMSQLNNTAASDSDSESIASSVPEFPSGEASEKEEDAVFIRNLPYTVKFNDLFDVFSKAGRIQYNPSTQKAKVFIFKNPNKESGFCTAKVIYTDQGSATAAVAKYNNQVISQWNTRLRVDISNPNRRNTKTSEKFSNDGNADMHNDARANADREEPVKKGQTDSNRAEQSSTQSNPAGNPNKNQSGRNRRSGGKPTG